MPNFEGPPQKPNQSVNEIFKEKWEQFIPEIGTQLEQKTNVSIQIGDEKLNIDYREIAVESQENKDGDIVVLLPGFGSGWEGIAELGFSLACEGRRVIMPSLPGYGNSDNPSKEYFQSSSFDNEVEVIKQLLVKIGLPPGSRVHLVGHSMGSEIFASFAEKYPDQVSSLVLLNPAGVKEKERRLAIMARFVSSGAKAKREYEERAVQGDEDYQSALAEFIPRFKSNFSGRLNQRRAEHKKVSRGHLLEKIKNTNCPITYISGELDTVYPPGDVDDPNSQLAKIIDAVNDKTRIEKSVMAGLRHNTTIAPDEITAVNIEHYLELAEQKRIGKKETS